MGRLIGEIRDASTGELVEARVQVIGPDGQPTGPDGSMWKRGPGEPFFYSGGHFSVEVPRGYSRVLVERGTEFSPWREAVEVGSHGVAIDVQLERWGNLPERGWHPGNTHIHYDELETDPDRRLLYDSRVENLRMTAVSILQRGGLPYATNRYPPGVLTEFTDTHHYVQSGEETRHNHDPNRPYDPGYGHVMLLNIRNIVDPVSSGLLVDAFSPDYPPLSYACDNAAGQDGLVIWCHNGLGMEAPVAAALGKVHAMNLFDPFWTDVEYGFWYHMLNCGIRLPASSGSDWFVSSANRVYALSGETFSYETWLAAVREGRTFITNGPALFVEVGGASPGETIEAQCGTDASVRVEWQSHYAVERVEVVVNGNVRKAWNPRGDCRAGSRETVVTIDSDSWVAARLSSGRRDSFGHPLWAHSSPVYISAGGRPPPSRGNSARYFTERIDESMEWVRQKGKFYSDAQRNEVLDLHAAGREYYRNMQD
ncbi:MAG: CehA/McbA family metallohydrolase [Acidimicrobiia bacterium]